MVSSLCGAKPIPGRCDFQVTRRRSIQKAPEPSLAVVWQGEVKGRATQKALRRADYHALMSESHQTLGRVENVLSIVSLVANTRMRSLWLR